MHDLPYHFVQIQNHMEDQMDWLIYDQQHVTVSLPAKIKEI